MLGVLVRFCFHGDKNMQANDWSRAPFAMLKKATPSGREQSKQTRSESLGQGKRDRKPPGSKKCGYGSETEPLCVQDIEDAAGGWGEPLSRTQRVKIARGPLPPIL